MDGEKRVGRNRAPKARSAGPDTPTRYETIVDAAAEIFARKGYAAASVQDVADAVGMLKGSLYHYIRTKEDLLHAVILEAHRSTVANGRRALDADGDGLAKLKEVIRIHIAGITGPTLTRTRVFYNEYTRLPAERFNEIMVARDSYERDVRRIVEIGQQDGSIRAQLDPSLTAIAILSILNTVQAWYRPDGQKTVDEIVEAFTEVIVAGTATHQVASPRSQRRSAKPQGGDRHAS